MSSPESRFDALTDRAYALYEKGRLKEALDLVQEPRPGLEPWFAELAHTEACLYGALGEPETALKTLRTASDAGGWWAAGILTDDEDLAALQTLPGFQELVALSTNRQVPQYLPAVIQLPAGERAGGVVVALHGAGQTATRTAREWAGVLELGYALVCVESSQAMSPMYRTWPDRDHSIEDIARALDELPDVLRGLPLIASGFSAGGRAALDWALTATPVAAAGVVVLAPALRELPAEAQGSLDPATVLIGTDDDLREVVEGAADQLTGFGLTVRSLPGLVHEYPQDFADRLAEILPSCG